MALKQKKDLATLVWNYYNFKRFSLWSGRKGKTNLMSLIKSKQLYVFLSVICAVGVFLMSDAFQRMAYWGEDLTWYWIGVGVTYFIWLMGIVFLTIAINRKSNIKGKLTFGLSILRGGSFIILICGFLWTSFVIIAGLSGI